MCIRDSIKGAKPPAVPRQLEAYSSSLSVVLADGTNTITDASVTFALDGKAVNAAPVRQGKYLTVTTGELPGFMAAGEAHSASLSFTDSAGTTRSQQWSAYNLQNLVLPASPVTGEDFNALPEATGPENTLPPGWTPINYT